MEYKYHKKINDNDTSCYDEEKLDIIGIYDMISNLNNESYEDILKIRKTLFHLSKNLMV